MEWRWESQGRDSQACTGLRSSILSDATSGGRRGQARNSQEAGQPIGSFQTFCSRQNKKLPKVSQQNTAWTSLYEATAYHQTSCQSQLWAHTLHNPHTTLALRMMPIPSCSSWYESRWAWQTRHAIDKRWLLRFATALTTKLLTVEEELPVWCQLCRSESGRTWHISASCALEQLVSVWNAAPGPSIVSRILSRMRTFGHRWVWRLLRWILRTASSNLAQNLRHIWQEAQRRVSQWPHCSCRFCSYFS